jgi:hypothetical protein
MLQASLNNSIAHRWEFCSCFIAKHARSSLAARICLLTKWINMATPQRKPWYVVKWYEWLKLTCQSMSANIILIRRVISDIVTATPEWA